MVRVKALDDLAAVSRRKSRVTSLFHRISWCGCGAESIIPSRPKSPTAQSVSSWRSALIAPNNVDKDEKSQDLSRYFDLDSIKYIDEDDDDEETLVPEASKCYSYTGKSFNGIHFTKD